MAKALFIGDIFQVHMKRTNVQRKGCDESALFRAKCRCIGTRMLRSPLRDNAGGRKVGEHLAHGCRRCKSVCGQPCIWLHRHMHSHIHALPHKAWKGLCSCHLKFDAHNPRNSIPAFAPPHRSNLWANPFLSLLPSKRTKLC